ncbi:OmpA family protein [Acinetobacter sp. FNA3]|uniref:OmpA family protein n=2 Tax=Moraxellaceae TaxID=468 RepID=UPI0018A2DDBE|nr:MULTISPECIES: OmpA family protein [Acinetobacter]MBF7689647.1 OmpA family protein [Acinetobacter pollinis]MBF7692635.1 OmpA family protein [Acinetobacter pollinis]MBF7698562.1 OmpA family protein [Acinetobacter pollinis]MBF7700675.1 OmpA family protein [Acinetobacter pollinis]WEV49824.1 OmpA family protein [Acinetobacter sp. ESL0695]
MNRLMLKSVITNCIMIASLGLTQLGHTQPIIIDGVVPNEASKKTVLDKLRSVYGNDQVVDQIEVRSVSAPHDWTSAVEKLINTDLKKVKQGQLTVQGTHVELTGKISDQNDKAIRTAFQSVVDPIFDFNSNLSIDMKEQKIVDDALKNRIIEFESGSAILTVTGQRILDEMALALQKLNGKSIKIIGHTDSSGDLKKNTLLSHDRAEAVKKYLISKGINPSSLSAYGLGSEKPVADNTTAEGRKKNRRIEFEVI